MLSEPLPSLDALRCFAEAARLLNFRAAARVVGLTPAALGQRIRQLEEALDAKLFHRTTRSVTLTERGLALVPHAQKALEAARHCVRAGRGDVGPAPVELCLGTRHELGLSWLLPMLPALRKAQPGMTLHLYFGSGPDLVHRVRSLLIDAAVSSTAFLDPKLDVVRLHEERYVFAASPKLLKKRPFSSFADAPLHTLVDISADLPLFRYWRDGDGAENLDFGSVLRMGTIAAIRHIVLRGEGVAVLPEYFVKPDLSAGRLKVILPRVTPKSDFFRLMFRADDPRRSVFERLGEVMLAKPLC